jgi:hypothetical protein
MTDKAYLNHLSPVELAALAHHQDAARDHRGEANMHSKWAKQIIDRARARMKARGETNV